MPSTSGPEMTHRLYSPARRRRLPLRLAPLAAFFLLAACDANPPGAGSSLSSTAVVALSSDVSGINPLTASGELTREVDDQLFLRLFEELADYDEAPPDFSSELATGHRWSADGLT